MRSPKTTDTTGVHGQRQGTSAPDGHWHPRSKRECCPICGRLDGKCRVKGDFVHCWKGDTYAPPDILTGTVITIGGGHWKNSLTTAALARTAFTLFL